MYKSKDLPLQFTVLMQMLNYEMSVKKYSLMKNTLNEIDTVINKWIISSGNTARILLVLL